MFTESIDWIAQWDRAAAIGLGRSPWTPARPRPSTHDCAANIADYASSTVLESSPPGSATWVFAYLTILHARSAHPHPRDAIAALAVWEQFTSNLIGLDDEYRKRSEEGPGYEPDYSLLLQAGARALTEFIQLPAPPQRASRPAAAQFLAEVAGLLGAKATAYRESRSAADQPMTDGGRSRKKGKKGVRPFRATKGFLVNKVIQEIVSDRGNEVYHWELARLHAEVRKRFDCGRSTVHSSHFWKVVRKLHRGSNSEWVQSRQSKASS